MTPPKKKRPVDFTAGFNPPRRHAREVAEEEVETCHQLLYAAAEFRRGFRFPSVRELWSRSGWGFGVRFDPFKWGENSYHLPAETVFFLAKQRVGKFQG